MTKNRYSPNVLNCNL